MSLFIGIEFTKNQLVEFILNESIEDFKETITDVIIFLDSNKDDFKYIKKGYNIECKTIKDVKNICDDFEKILENPFLILSDDWNQMTLKVIDGIIEEFVENYTLRNGVYSNKAYTLFIILNKEKYYLGLQILTLNERISLSELNKINEKKIKILGKFKTKFYSKNILPIHENLQEKINKNLISIIIQYHITDISKNKIESILTIE